MNSIRVFGLIKNEEIRGSWLRYNCLRSTYRLLKPGVLFQYVNDYRLDVSHMTATFCSIGSKIQMTIFNAILRRYDIVLNNMSQISIFPV